MVIVDDSRHRRLQQLLLGDRLVYYLGSVRTVRIVGRSIGSCTGAIQL